MLFWGLKKRDLQIRIFGVSFLVHIILLGATYTFFVYKNSRVLSFGGSLRGGKKGKAVRFTLAQVANMHRNSQTAQVETVQPAMAPQSTNPQVLQIPTLQPKPIADPVRKQPERVAMPVALKSDKPELPKKIKEEKAKTAVKAEPESPKTSAVYKVYTKLVLGDSPTEETKKEESTYTKLQKPVTKLLKKEEQEAQPEKTEKKVEAPKTEQKVEQVKTPEQPVKSTQDIDDPHTSFDKLRMSGSRSSAVASTPIPLVQSGQESGNLEVTATGDSTGELIIGDSGPATGELELWEQQLVLAIKERLVFPAGFADREELSITVFVDLHGKITITHEEGCDIPALRALVRKFFKNFEYPAEMRGKQRTFKII